MQAPPITNRQSGSTRAPTATATRERLHTGTADYTQPPQHVTTAPLRCTRAPLGKRGGSARRDARPRRPKSQATARTPKDARTTPAPAAPDPHGPATYPQQRRADEVREAEGPQLLARDEFVVVVHLHRLLLQLLRDRVEESAPFRRGAQVRDEIRHDARLLAGHHHQAGVGHDAQIHGVRGRLDVAERVALAWTGWGDLSGTACL